ncbi:hypothetical protein F383_24864 [Gossypium arboreum]|uniref:Uncharacterized protein n=1 Tax=Gossypium arboreum TaxID=29729 RepID=A0A0B0P1R1_GOSAR|nr:hypothetical protein F383_24864 [Gossypium arboreum]
MTFISNEMIYDVCSVIPLNLFW